MTRTLATILAAGLATTAAAQSTPVLTRAPIITRSADDKVRPAAVIYEQLTDWSFGMYSQDIPDFPSFSIYVYDDFTLQRDEYLSRSVATGWEQGYGVTNEYTVAQIWTDIADRGGTLVAESRNQNSAPDLAHEWDAVHLRAGVRYYFTTWVRRVYRRGGAWSWATTTTVTGSQSQIWNPGGGWLFSTSSQDGWNLYGTAYDMAFRLEENGPPPPPPPPPPGCYPDCTGDDRLDVRDFFCFQGEFGRRTPYADCDGNLLHDVRDFFCFQAAFAAGCR